MKAKVVFFIGMMLFGLASIMAQPINSSDVPEDVFTSFKLKYPDASMQGWETSKGNFIANFKQSGQEAVAEFTANGKWLATRFIVPEKELPSPIINYYKENYKARGFNCANKILFWMG